MIPLARIGRPFFVHLSIRGIRYTFRMTLYVFPTALRNPSRRSRCQPYRHKVSKSSLNSIPPTCSSLARRFFNYLQLTTKRDTMPSISAVNGTTTLESSTSSGMPLTEYTANPSPTSAEKPKASSSVPAAFLLSSGYPDVSTYGL